MTSILASHIILTPTQPVRSGLTHMQEEKTFFIQTFLRNKDKSGFKSILSHSILQVEPIQGDNSKSNKIAERTFEILHDLLYSL